jgi:hypothetical protein
MILDVKKLATVTKEQGAIGVLALWLVWTTFKLYSVEGKLLECYKDQVNTSQLYNDGNPSSNLLATLPKELKIEKL